MNLRQLRIFKEAAQTENMTEAAKNLYLSQSAVSQTIHELEEELDIQLFHRQGRSVKLSSLGQDFLKRALFFLEEYKQLEVFAKTIKEQPLKIGTTITVANQWLPSILTDWQLQGGQASIVVDTAERILQLLTDRTIDLGLIEGAIDTQHFTGASFASYELKVIVSKQHPCANQKSMSLEDLLSQPLILRDTSSAIRQTLDSWLLLHHVKAHPFITSINSQAILELVRKNLGITVLPELLLDHCHGKEDFVCLSLKGTQLINNAQVVFNKEQKLTQQMKEFQAVTVKSNTDNS